MIIKRSAAFHPALRHGKPRAGFADLSSGGAGSAGRLPK
jgi:hypothetical protein